MFIRFLIGFGRQATNRKSLLFVCVFGAFDAKCIGFSIGFGDRPTLVAICVCVFFAFLVFVILCAWFLLIGFANT